MAAEGWLMMPENGTDTYNFDGKSSSVKYCVTGTDDLSEANAWVVANAPATYFSMSLKNINHERVATNVWFFSVVYDGKFQGSAPESASGPNVSNTALNFQFETILESFHISEALNATSYFTPPIVDAEFGNVIGISPLPDQPPQGIEIGTGVSRWTETYKLPVAWVTGAYELVVDGLTSQINNATFRGRRAKCVQFVGMRSRACSTEYIEASYSFEYRRPRLNYTVGDITAINKEGFQVEEVIYDVNKDVAAKQITRKPLYVRIMDVIEEGDFSTLGIGTGARP